MIQSKITCDFKDSQISDQMLKAYQSKVDTIHSRLHSGKEEFTGWVNYGKDLDEKLISDLETTAKKIQSQCTAFIVLGIGGSYLGSRAAIEMLNHTFHNEMPGKLPKIYYAGHTISTTYMNDLLDVVKNEEIAIAVISKSGTTIETSVAFGIFKELLIEKYGDKYSERVYAITDESKGILRPEADEKGYKSFIIPDAVGGRFSVITPVGLLPIAVAGINIRELIQGNKDATELFYEKDIMKNEAYKYGLARYILNEELGKTVECLEVYENKLKYLVEWMKQLFGESEGKAGQGLFPVTVELSTELHSLGQFLQEGNQIFAETVIHLNNTGKDIEISEKQGYGSDWTMKKLNDVVTQGVIEAHQEGINVPTVRLNIEELTPYSFGFIVYFFETACSINCYLRDINPFDQPGVEQYKAAVRRLMNKN